MCGIIGYTGSEDVREVLLDALELLEYRGYDSAGIALRDEESGKTEVRKCAGRVSDLRAICASEKVRNRSYEMGDAWWCERLQCTPASSGKSHARTQRHY